MKVIIPIKRSTVRMNPHAGESVFYFPGKPTGHRYNNYDIQHCGTEWCWTSDVFVLSDANKDMALKVSEGVSMRGPEKPPSSEDRWTMNRQAIHTLTPQPPFLYEYEDPEITCPKCGKKQPLSGVKLKTMFDEDEMPLNHCVACEQLLDLDLDYEKLTNDELAGIAYDNEEKKT